MTSTLNLLDNYTIRENSNGNYELVHDTNGVVERYDETADILELLKNIEIADLVDSTSGNTVYDSSTETLGDGNQSANITELLSGIEISDLTDGITGNLVYDSSNEQYGDGTPQRMVAQCTNCGRTYRGGTVTVWLERGPEGYLSQVRDDVSFLCTKGCEEVHDMEVRVLERV